VARINYLTAKSEVRYIDLYAMDLVWKLVQMKTDAPLPMPSELWANKNKVDKRSSKQIIKDLLDGLGGE